MGEENKPQSGELTKKCPKCGEEILASAKRCKHCQADLRNWFARHNVFTGIIIFIVLMAIIGASDSDEKNTNINIPASSDSPVVADTSLMKKTVSLNNDPSIKQLSALTADYVGKSFTLRVNAETSDYYNYGFDDATKYYSLRIWDDSVGSYFEGIYAYLDKNDTNKQLVNSLLNSSAQLEISASIPTAKWTSGSNAFMKIDSWKLLD